MIQGLKYYLGNTLSVATTREFKGWGRKRTGTFASWCQKIFGGVSILHEDGFIRSLGLGITTPSFSMVSDKSGIYYDATVPSDLEEILLHHDFEKDEALMSQACKAIGLMLRHQISKYNHATDLDDPRVEESESKQQVLIIAQTLGDMSLRYGMTEQFTTDAMIEAAIDENPDATIYMKVHPDVVSGKKKSDIDLIEARKKCIIIDGDVNPISLLSSFDKVYTKTSQMGFEALLVGCETVCFGMPFYAGWGITDDRVKCERRARKLSVEEVFAAAYILYSDYYNPYTKKPSDIIDTIGEIVWRRGLSQGLSRDLKLPRY